MPTNPRPPRCRTHRRRTKGCRACKVRASWEQAERRRAAAAGMPATVDSTRMRAHLETLIAARVPHRDIAARSGVSIRHLHDLIHNCPPRIHRDTEAAILGVPVGPSSRRIPALGTARRVRAMLAAGHTQATIGSWICDGVTGARVGQLANMANPSVTPEMAAAVRAAYEQHGHTLGLSKITAKRARRRGWHTAAEWGSADLDDPAARPEFAPSAAACHSCGLVLWLRSKEGPDPALVEAVLDGRQPITAVPDPVRTEVVRRLAAQGIDDVTIAARTRWPASAHTPPWKLIAKYRERRGIPAGRPMRKAA